MPLGLFPTCLVGSYPQPDWLIDREMLGKRMPPRTRATELWRVAPPWLEQAQDDATRLAIIEQEKAGLDIITDGEMRRESYSNRFATALAGLDMDNPATIRSRTGNLVKVPRIVGEIRRKYPVQVRDVQFLRANTDRKIKITVPGAFTMAQQASNEYYPDEKSAAMAYADAVNGEINDLFAAGADVVQIDEPYLQSAAARAREYGVEVITRALRDVRGTTALHTCFGYAALVNERPAGYAFLRELADTPVHQISIETAQSKLDCSTLLTLPLQTIILGVIDLSTPEIESPETVAARIRRALPYINPERLIISPDCGMKYLPRKVAFGKLQAMVKGAEMVRKELLNGSQARPQAVA